jgi:ribosomal-protein-alanine N-acetyltransferase
MLVFPILETKRLILRPIGLQDVDAVFAYAKNPLVGPNAGWKPHTDISESKKFIEYCIKKRDFGQPGNYAMIYKEDNKMIGTIEVHSFKGHKGEVGFVLHPDYWNKGIMTEAGKMIVIYAFEILQLKRLSFNHFLFNNRSKRVCEKLGFIYEGTLRKKFQMYDGACIDEAVYSLTDDDYNETTLPWLHDFKKELNLTD